MKLKPARINGAIKALHSTSMALAPDCVKRPPMVALWTKDQCSLPQLLWLVLNQTMVAINGVMNSAAAVE
jgi:hypothetical protein